MLFCHYYQHLSLRLCSLRMGALTYSVLYIQHPAQGLDPKSDVSEAV